MTVSMNTSPSPQPFPHRGEGVRVAAESSSQKVEGVRVALPVKGPMLTRTGWSVFIIALIVV